uniref:Translation initiation factor 5-like protein n=1 Tax=Schistosoma japonicum TaxID=6182 RepID=Q64GL3_SCHJA|nr:translation initiation factor 5-like protein [Schistosoma japonicum]
MAKLIERYSDHDLLSKACHILKTLYDCDIVEEDVILGWYDRGPSKKFVSRELSTKILARCAPMVTWLRQAEEEESESSEGESENNSPKTTHPVNGSNGTEAVDANGTGDDDDDVDIDAI